jgi:hypothetical protein
MVCLFFYEVVETHGRASRMFVGKHKDQWLLADVVC